MCLRNQLTIRPQKKLPNVSLLPEPVVTRWVPWIEAVLFYNKILNANKGVVNDFDSIVKIVS